MYIDEVDRLLVAAVGFKDAALEMDSSVDPVLRATSQQLAEAVYGWQEWDSLRRELEGEDIWTGAVFDVADAPRVTGNYAEHVERVIAAANQVNDVVFSRAVLTIPDRALPAADALIQAVAAHRGLGMTAEERYRLGERPRVIAGATPPDEPPPVPDGPSPGTRHWDDGATLGLAPAALDHGPTLWATPAPRPVQQQQHQLRLSPPHVHGPRP